MNLLPLSREIGRVLTTSGLPLFAGLFLTTPFTNTQKASKMIIEFLALSGVLMNTVSATSDHGRVAGFVKGVITVVISFILPGMFMTPALGKVCGIRCTKPWHKIVAGLGLVIVLALLEKILDYYFVSSLHSEPDYEY